MPAVAVIRRVQALSGFIGRKAFRRRFCKLHFKYQSSTLGRGVILRELKYFGAFGTVGVGVKSVDIDRNTKGEGRKLGIPGTIRYPVRCCIVLDFDAEERQLEERKGWRISLVPSTKRLVELKFGYLLEHLCISN